MIWHLITSLLFPLCGFHPPSMIHDLSETTDSNVSSIDDNLRAALLKGTRRGARDSDTQMGRPLFRINEVIDRRYCDKVAVVMRVHAFAKRYARVTLPSVAIQRVSNIVCTSFSSRTF